MKKVSVTPPFPQPTQKGRIEMNEQKQPKILRPFLNRHITVKTYDDIDLSGELIHVDKSLHPYGTLGNLILHWNGGVTIIRGDSVQFIALNQEVT